MTPARDPKQGDHEGQRETTGAKETTTGDLDGRPRETTGGPSRGASHNLLILEIREDPYRRACLGALRLVSCSKSISSSLWHDFGEKAALLFPACEGTPRQICLENPKT